MHRSPVSFASFDTRPLSSSLGAEILGVQLSRGVNKQLFQDIYQAFLEYQVLLFDVQPLSPGQQVEFARFFGEVQIHVMNQYHSDAYPELYRLSNVDEHGKPNGKYPDKGTMAWHTDGSWRQITGQATILFAEMMPSHGGETHFCDMYGAYERLSPEWKERITGLRAVHNLDFSRNRRHAEEPMTDAQRRQVPPVDHPVVRTHPETGKRCLFLGDHAEYIVGMDYDQGRKLIDELNNLAIHPDLIYAHRWLPGQLIVWDNRCLLHRGTEYDVEHEPRVIRRCTVLGEIPQE